MKLWTHNKISGEYELSEQDGVDRFVASTYADDPWPLNRALGVFIGYHEPNGLASAWKVGDPAFERTVDLILPAWRAASPGDQAARERDRNE